MVTIRERIKRATIKELKSQGLPTSGEWFEKYLTHSCNMEYKKRHYKIK